MNKVNSDEETKIDSLKKAWTRINYLERREAELEGLLFDALQGAKITPADLICSACGSACGTPRGVAHDLDLSDCCLAKIVA